MSTVCEISESSIIDDLGGLATNCNDPFCCSGELDEPAKIAYNNKGLWNAATFPSDNEEAMLSGLMEASSFASFGVGGETVTDVTYRDARKLEPENFLTSIHLSSTSILPLLLKALGPNLGSIRTQLHKLNVYGPGGHFKPHVDTPRSADMFGSLVVCLPTRFTGGSLVLRHRKQEVIYDWSSTPDHPARTIKWAAFFSNIEHEILPVTSGHRVTLTYNLYREGSEMLRPALTSPEITAFKKYFIEALSNPHFMRTGGILGFRCQHSYVLQSLNDEELLPSMLKGADYSIFVEVKSLGIPVAVKPYVRNCEMDQCYILNSFRTFRSHLGQYDEGEANDDFTMGRAVYDLFGRCVIRDLKVRWCQPIINYSSMWEPAGAVVTYGNEASVGCFYQAAAIYVGIPKWGKHRQIIAGMCDGDRQSMEEEVQEDEGTTGSEKESRVSEGGSNGHSDDGDMDKGSSDRDNEEGVEQEKSGEEHACSDEGGNNGRGDLIDYLMQFLATDHSSEDKDDEIVFMKIFGQKCDY